MFFIQQESTEEEVCRGCGFQGPRLLQHLRMTTKDCRSFYDMGEWQTVSRKKNSAKCKKYYESKKEIIREKQQEYKKENRHTIRGQKQGYYQENRENLRGKHQEYYQDNIPQRRSSMKQRYKANKDDIAKIKAVRKAIMFANENESQGRPDFDCKAITA